MKKNIYFVICLLLLLIACNNPNYDMPGMFNGTSPEVATRFAHSMDYNATIGETHLSVPADYRIYVCTDSHIDSTHHNLEQFVLAYKSDSLCPVALHLGDLINAQGNYPHAYRTLQVEPTMAHRDTLFIRPATMTFILISGQNIGTCFILPSIGSIRKMRPQANRLTFLFV